MRLFTYDCEVFAYDYLVTIKDRETGHKTRIWNDNEAVRAYAWSKINHNQADTTTIWK